MTTGYKQYGITFNGHHSSEYGAYVLEGGKVAGFPAKNKIVQTLPGSNQVLDLSNLYGPTFAERTLSFTFTLLDNALVSRELMYRTWTQILNWLMAPAGKAVLQDDLMPDWHYLAEVQNAPTLSEDTDYNKLTIEFQCYPFRIKNTPEFDDVWDHFDFEIGVAQQTQFAIGGRDSGTLINVGPGEIPFTVKSSADATLVLNGQPYKVKTGENTSSELVLSPGDNFISLSGDSGTAMTVSWYQEVI